MELLDVRRLTGPGVIWDHPGAIMDVRCTQAEAEALWPRFEHAARRMQSALGWSAYPLGRHRFASGSSYVMAAPLDALYTATEVLEWVWTQCDPEAAGADESFAAASARLRASLAGERNPRLAALIDAARDAAVPFLTDDEAFSLGYGCHSQSWPIDALPAVDSLDYTRYAPIPVALVTGVNGKTTTVRLLSRIAAAAGLRCGASSTDWLMANGRIIDAGDYSGPGGARTILRQPDVDCAVLETARGGLLRRGLGVDRADAAVITNIAEDHLGDYGSETLDELCAIKFVVARALGPRGLLVLNADDPRLVAGAQALDRPLLWFSLDPELPLLSRHQAAGGAVATVRDDALQLFDGARWLRLAAVDEVPVTLAGAARHNIANALAAIGLAHGLGLPPAAIGEGLRALRPEDNPGRCNLIEVDGVRVLVDFAHNPQGIEALFEMAQRLPAGRRFLAFAQAGDRTDAQIRELARAAWRLGAERYLVSELAAYYRGRSPGEVFGLIRAALIDCGAEATRIEHHEREIDALRSALAAARPGDLVIMLALGERAAVLDHLAAVSTPGR